MKYEELIEISKSLLFGNISILALNFIAIGCAILGVYFHSRIKKAGELSEINANFADIKRQQVELEKATGDIKQSLKLSEIKYQAKVGNYQEKQIEATDLVYKSIIDLRDAVRDLGFVVNDETKGNFRTKVVEFRSQFELNRIWVDKSLSVQVNAFAKELDDYAHRHMRNAQKSERFMNLSDSQLDKIMDEQEGFYDFIYKEVNERIDELVDNIIETLSTET